MVHELFQVLNWLGSDWILIILASLSVTTLGIGLQRWMEMRSLLQASDRFQKDQMETWFLGADASSWQKDVVQLHADYPCLETDVLDLISRTKRSGEIQPERMVQAYLEKRKLGLEKMIGVLGTIGANAPFIGLLGTVLGIIRAFHNMSVQGLGGGMESISSGIAEALVATAIGLFVAIPAVVAYNLFNRRIATLLKRAQSVSLLALSQSGK